MRAFACISLVALLSGAAFGQSPPAPPKFDIADVHSSARGANLYMTGGVLRGGRYDVRNATMVDLIRTAYGVDDNSKIAGGPPWLDTDRFDIIAKAPPATSPDTVNLMLQSLLADRFKLVVHPDSKPMPVFVLSRGKGKPKLKQADGSGNGCQPPPQGPPPEPGVSKVVLCRNMTMQAFAPLLRNMAGVYVNSPVVDQTGLKGTWDFDLKWTQRTLLPQAGADGITIFDAVEKQLGLKLEPQKIPLPVIVVDSVNQKPTDNPQGVTTSLPPPPPAEFEVADIRPSAPGVTPGGGLLPGGRIDLKGYPMKGLVQIAWNIDNPDEMIVGPKWLDSARFDIIAKAYSTAGPNNAPQIDIDDLRLMLRALLKDRFKIVTHTEDRPVTAYKLTAAKPKLQKADPSNRTGCKEGPGADGKDPRIATPVLARLVSCQNMTMAQLAEQFQSIASGYVQSAVVDATGLEGAFDFTLNFSPVQIFQNGGLPGQPVPAAGAGTASDPSGALSLFDAVNKQLGLKLEAQKRPMPVLVIDHIEEKPTDN